ncbi:hypothetical protein SAMN05444340_10620 [Citreimonas salinaria]|uniref:AMP-binding enzyme C-terminal domain-containing protein n=1 Tax=Citreimonas salinaria TaxID=321339 RepID=A0A1H3J2E7_9RHOB|nr:hypothetical protein SAMN05444340_10620 [Citreimonas salinaria]
MPRARARYKHPRDFRVVQELPRNVMGKVQKNVLRDTHTATPTATPSRPSPVPAPPGPAVTPQAARRPRMRRASATVATLRP